jgi:hypothetical protein
MKPINSVFIVEPDNQGWIIERLMRDIADELSRRNIATRLGKGNAYQQEDVIFNSRYLSALSDPRARVNSLFITHVDDKSKELDLKSSFNRFNSFVCLSPQDAEFVNALKGDAGGVVGIELPTREENVRPVRLAMFSARYDDGRKNEQWLLDYFRDRTPTERARFTLCFLGWGWESFCASLAELDVSYEIYRYSRFAPGEYGMYKNVLPGCDALLYLGFDGGAMSVYDGISANIPVIASNISYHRGLGEGVSLFDDEAGFHRELARLLKNVGGRADALSGRSIAAYTTRLLAHWNGVAGAHQDPGLHTGVAPANEADRRTLETFRQQYKPMSIARYKAALIRWFQTRSMRS